MGLNKIPPIFNQICISLHLNLKTGFSVFLWLKKKNEFKFVKSSRSLKKITITTKKHEIRQIHPNLKNFKNNF